MPDPTCPRADPPAPAAGPRLFLLRVWPRPAVFRAVLHEVGRDELSLFATADALARHVHALWAGLAEEVDADVSRAPPVAAHAPCPTSSRDDPGRSTDSAPTTPPSR